MDSLIVLMEEIARNELAASWFTRNANWLVPTLVTIFVQLIAVLVILCTTKKQISVSIQNTTDQIKNQNKESHRPYLTEISVGEIKVEFFNAYFVLKNSKEYEKVDDPIPTQLLFNNIGYGIATNIALIDFGETYCGKAGIDGKEIGKLFSILDVGTNNTGGFRLKLSPDKNKVEDSFDLMLFYTDLNKNIYSAMVLIETYEKSVKTTYYYPENTADFASILRKRKERHKDIKQKYIKRYLQEK